MLEWGNDGTPNNGRVVLVTGAARGIGLGIGAWLITEGWQVVLADIDRERGSRVARALGDNAWFVAMDVAKEDQVSVGVAEVLGQFGRLDALVCNAAISDPCTPPLESLDLRRWNRMLAVNLTGAMLLAKHCAPYLRAHRGAIVNIASTRASQSEADCEAYAASKVAWSRSLMRCRSAWGRRFGSTVSALVGSTPAILRSSAWRRFRCSTMRSIRSAVSVRWRMSRRRSPGCCPMVQVSSPGRSS